MIFTVTAILSRTRRHKCHGYFLSLAEAQRAVEENHGLTECVFNWVVIESYQPGVPAIADDTRYWYHFNEVLGEFLLVEPPDWSIGLTNWAIG